MMGCKTTGSWDDVTSIGRNEIVFEGRNQAYGAFYLRKRYNYVLLMGLLTSMSAGVITAGVPFILRLFYKNNIATKPYEHNRDRNDTIVINIPMPPKPPAARPLPPAPPHPPQATNSTNPPPEVTNNPNRVDSTQQTARDIQATNPGAVVTGAQTGPADPQPPSIPATLPSAPEEPVNWAKVMPEFPGDLNDYILSHTNYPAIPKEMGIEGTVYVTFVVEKDGSVSNIKILKGVAGGEELSDETIRMLKAMPAWQPGSQDGHPVRVRFNLPVKFQLK